MDINGGIKRNAYGAVVHTDERFMNVIAGKASVNLQKGNSSQIMFGDEPANQRSMPAQAH